MSVEQHKIKQQVIDEIKDKLDRASATVIIDYIGITVDEANDMRKKLREADVDYKVYKNKLVERAVDGTDYEQLKEVLAGPSAFAFSYDDSTAPARILNGVMKDIKKMEFKAGIIDGEFYDVDGLKEIASVPSRDELLAKFLGSIQSPISTFVRTLQAVADDKAEGGEAAPAEEKPAEEAAPAEEKAEDKPAEEAAPAEEKAEEKPAEEAAPAEEKAEDKPAEEAAPAEEKAEEKPAEEAKDEE